MGHLASVRKLNLLLVGNGAAGWRRARRARIVRRRAIARWKRLVACYNLVPVARLRRVVYLRHCNFCDFGHSCYPECYRGAAPRKTRTHRAAPHDTLLEASQCLLQPSASCALAPCPVSAQSLFPHPTLFWIPPRNISCGAQFFFLFVR